ncbi:MAG: alkaline phosphatase family protein, partial [Oscillospiraceae bacterium]|nr:alkaline phosphatase family protein [Oscillospiraceae bacterium]
MEKTMLILCDGMRPDSIEACLNPYAKSFAQQSLVAMQGQTIMPSVTLPCIMSLFTSAMPQNHGIFTLQYAAPLTPIQGLFEQVTTQGAKCAMFYTWEELRDLAKPGSLAFSACVSEVHAPCSACDAKAVELAIEF